MGYSHYTGLTVIVERVLLISNCCSFSFTCIKTKFRSVQLNREWVHSVFQSEWNSSFVRVRHFILVYHVNWKQVSDWRKKTMWDRSRLNALDWVGRFYHVNAVRTYPANRSIFPRSNSVIRVRVYSGKKLIPEWKSFRNERHFGII